MNFKPTIIDQQKLDQAKSDWIASIDKSNPVYIFAYGSLMWKPSCNITKQFAGVLNGYQRDFCMYSYMYRGNLENVGLMLGIHAGGSCDGMVMEICPNNLENDLSCLWDREMVTGAYTPILQDVKTEDGNVNCWVFVANTDHNQWAGILDENQQAELIAKASGDYGTNTDYLFNTVEQLQKMGIKDEKLESLATATQKLL